jgi:O-antigen/teichoic acid export membrane protein
MDLSPYGSPRGMLYLITKAFVVGISSAVFFILIVRTLPEVSDLGLFQGLQSSIIVGATLAGSGLSRAAIRFISAHIGGGKEKLAEAICSTVFRICLFTSALLFLIVSTCAFTSQTYSFMNRITRI